MFTIRIADTIVQIDNRYDFIKDYCKNYITENEMPDIVIGVTEEEIYAEQSVQSVATPQYLETLAVYRKLCERLLERDIVLLHSSTLMIDGRAVLFLAPSGTGKSTHAALWREVFGERVTMINDDKPLVSIKDGCEGVEIRVYGTPWCGKHGLENNISAPVSAVFLLRRGTENVAESIGVRSAFPDILNQIYRPKDEMLMRKTLLLARRFAENVNIYEIVCNMEQEAAKVAYKAAFEKL